MKKNKKVNNGKEVIRPNEVFPSSLVQTKCDNFQHRPYEAGPPPRPYEAGPRPYEAGPRPYHAVSRHIRRK